MGNWWSARQRDPNVDEMWWRRTSPAISEANLISLRGLPDRIVAEVLYGLQQRTDRGIQVPFRAVRPLVDRARKAQVASLDELDPKSLTQMDNTLRTSMINDAYLVRATPEAERYKDVWNAAVFGYRGTIRFAGISQPWLREATKHWAFDDLPQRRGTEAHHAVQARINALERLSESLRLQRHDHGDRPSVLGRDDITAYSNRMAFLVEQGTLSSKCRGKEARYIHHVLARMRKLSLHRPGKPLAGLPDEFTFDAYDLPEYQPSDGEPDRDLPVEVIRHLCDYLPSIESHRGRELRVAVELLIDTGRRPKEIASLSWDCLQRDGDGKPVLVYHNHKAGREGRRLPISEVTAAVITGQQDWVCARFPDTPIGKLTLLPSALANPHGGKAITSEAIAQRHRVWVEELPDVYVPTVVVEAGRRVTKMRPFDKSKVFLYAYRHSFAQRHADAGVDVTVLKELMDHEEIAATQVYYRVGQERRRAAVERVTAMEFDRHGNRIWRKAQQMLESEHTRRAVGEVATPYGGCSEPSNVAADGQDCPLRWRCLGCEHFHTDVSYLPDLERYLADLLRHRERLAATTAADEWARREAMPSDAEITRVRRLIERMKADVEELSDEERAQIEKAVAVIRRSRTQVVNIGMPRVRQPLPDVRPERSA